ncbi:hypothetical protein Tco_0538335 [Tanacetum coccineum]
MPLLSLRAISDFLPLQMFLKFRCTNSGILSTIHGQNFDELPSDEDIVSFFKELPSVASTLENFCHYHLQKSIGKDNCPKMRETKAYKTYIGYTTGVTPPKKARKFKKPISPKLYNVLVLSEEPTRKSKRVKRPAKKSSKSPTASVVIRDTPVMSSSKKKEKTHPSGSGIVTSAAKIKPFVINEGTGAKPGVPDVTEESTESEAESWRKDKDDNNNDHDSRSEGRNQERDSGDDNTQSDSEKGSDSGHETDENESGSESDQEENEEEIEDDEEDKRMNKAEGDEDEGMDYTTNQFDDDVDLSMNEPVTIDEGFIQKEGTDYEMINVEQGNENPEISINQVIEDAHVTLSTMQKIVSPLDVPIHHEVLSNQTPTLLTIPVYVISDSSPVYSTVIAQSLQYFTPPPPQSAPIPTPTTEATNPPHELPNFTSVFQFNNRVATLKKEVVELKKNDPPNTQVTALVDEHLDSRLGATRDEFISYISESIAARITEQVKSQLP